MSWFAHRDDGWEAKSERVLGELRDPDRALDGRAGGGALPVVRRRATWRWVLHEPEAGVLRAQQAVQTLARQAAVARGAELVRARATPAGDGGGARRRAHARGRPDRVELRRLAGEALPRARDAARDAPGAVLLRRRAGLAGRARVGRLRPRDLRDRRPARPRREGRLGPGGPAAGPRRRPPARDRRETEALDARLRRRSLPRARRRAAEGLDDLPLRDLRRQPLHRRPAPGARRASGSSAAAPATASSTARRWPSGSRPPGTAARRSRPTSRSASAAPGASLRSAGSNL